MKWLLFDGKVIKVFSLVYELDLKGYYSRDIPHGLTEMSDDEAREKLKKIKKEMQK